MKMNFTQMYVFVFLILIISCSSDSIKENINKTGDVAGQAIGEFATGVTTGVKKAIEPKIEISENLKSKGIAFGKMTISSDSTGKDNILTAYLIFNLEYSGTITAKAFDNKNQEMGRVRLEINGQKDDAGYFEFCFDRRTEITNDCRLLLE